MSLKVAVALVQGVIVGIMGRDLDTSDFIFYFILVFCWYVILRMWVDLIKEVLEAIQ